MTLKEKKHQPGLLFDTVQLLETGLLGSRVLVMVGGGEERTGAALEEGTEEIFFFLLKGEGWILKTTVTYSPVLLYSPEVKCAVCVLSEAILVLFGRGSGRAGSVGGLPCSCHCLSTRKRLPPFSCARAHQSPACVPYPSAERQLVRAERFHYHRERKKHDVNIYPDSLNIRP